MAVRDKVRIVGKYKGTRDVLTIGGRQFQKDQITDTYVDYDMYLKLKEGATSGWFELVYPPQVVNGVDGKSVELQTVGTKLQWRQTGGEWADLIDLATVGTP